jgi:hypothetical protein
VAAWSGRVMPFGGRPLCPGGTGTPAGAGPALGLARDRKGRLVMSLVVPAELHEQAGRGEVEDEQFVECVRASLPYAWSVISGLVEQLPSHGEGFADNQVPPPDEAAQGQLLRALAGDAMRGALERHFGVRLAFQNCHRVAVFAPGAPAGAYAEFVSPRAQILNQSPELVNC